MQEVKSNKYVLSQAYIKILYINLQLEGKILSSMRRQSYDLGWAQMQQGTSEIST